MFDQRTKNLMTTQYATAARPARTMLRLGAVLTIVGTLLFAAMSALHGNPPIEDAAGVLDYVAARPWWRAAHLANILAVLLWVGALGMLAHELRHEVERGLARLARGVLVAASAVFAVYFSINGFGWAELAHRWTSATGESRADLLIEMNVALTMVGSVAFTAQALLGLSVLLYGLTLISGSSYPSWLGWLGAVAGMGWLVGAIVIRFDVIVFCMALAWAWMVGLGILMWRRAPSTGTP
ncbi:MAG: hypothetical protein ACRDUV_22045 [Pseudonocardiaceae bacterium]